MYIDKEKALKELEMIRKSLVENASAEDMMDDGRDTDDAGQNASIQGI